jgi:predicted nucleic acid-binding protein
MKITFVDAGVLIAAVRGQGESSRRAFAILDDPGRRFASSRFVMLETLPKPMYFRMEDEVVFLESFFAGVTCWPESDLQVIERALDEAARAGLNAIDALHVAAAADVGADELVTTEKSCRALHRATTVPIRSIYW